MTVEPETNLNAVPFATSSFVRHRHDPDVPGSLSSDRVRTLLFAGDDEVWVGTYDGGIQRAESSSRTEAPGLRMSFSHYRHDPADPTTPPADGIWSIFQDRDDILWFGTVQGLAEWRPATESFVRYQHDHSDVMSLSDGTVASILQDRGGVLWVGTFSGLNKWIVMIPWLNFANRMAANAPTSCMS